MLCVSNSPPTFPGSSGSSLYYNGSSWRYPRTNVNSNIQVYKVQLQAGFTAFTPECSAVFGRIYSCSCSTKYKLLLSCRPKLSLCKPSRVSWVLSLVGCVDTTGCICSHHPITSVPKSFYSSGEITVKDVSSTKIFPFPPSVVVFIIMSLLVTCNCFPRRYFPSFQWQLVLNDNAGLEGRGVVLWFPVVSLGNKVFWHIRRHVDSVYKTFIRDHHVICTLQTCSDSQDGY